ncbi:MAG: 50S ribosomal protein L2 [Chlamydiia bacterium]|nr:50S ribosomal protein L2 [Chlamydiia bacterium]MCH9618483.1 50S ribosomal protein L2 [Chlamydiia bacterium]MCH9623772.1 50S ribosomal protein L2 [Chlamydiia bacterium]
MVRKYKPTTPGRRTLVLPSIDELTKGASPLKSLLSKKTRCSAKNNKGHITSRGRGGGHRKHYRIIDFKRDKDGIKAKVASIEYDPNRSAHIALLHYLDGEKRYIIAPKGLKAGDFVQSGVEAPLKTGNCLPLKSMPSGSTIHNIELQPGKGAQMIRSAGSSAQLMAKSGGYATLKMPSGEVRLVNDTCRATLGVISNAENNLMVIGKAGRNRWKGKRPISRGTVTNPVDGCMGGGEGRQNSYHPSSPWGTPAKGFRTRSKSKSKRLIVKDRRKK